MANQRRTALLFCIPVVLSALVLAAPLLRKSPSSAANVDPDKFALELPGLIERTPPADRLNLLLKYSDSPQYGIRRAAIETLGEYHDPRAAAALERAYLDSASIIRQRALEQMYDLDPKRGVQLLLEGLHDDDVWLRDAAAMRIMSLVRGHKPGFDRSIVPSLIRALDDSSDAVVAFSMTTLKRLTGLPWTVSSRAPNSMRVKVINQWKAWWKRHAASYPGPNVPAVQPTRSDPCPDFEFVDIDRKIVNAASMRGRITLLNFWGTWCGPCRIEVPELARIDRDFRGRGVDVIGVALGERNGAEGLRKWCGDHMIAYRQALSQDSLLEAFDHIDEVPVTILIDRQGRVRRRWDAERDYGTFRAAIEACN